MILKPNVPFRFSYSVRTVNDPKTEWTMRLDHYVKFGNSNIHMMSILLSLSVILASSLVVCLITKRALSLDFRSIE